MTIDTFLHLLQAQPNTATIFNPWSGVDLAYDNHEDAPAIRAYQLRMYLAQRLPHARVLLVAEGLSYQGGRFSGIAMTSERILLGGKPEIPANAVFYGEKRQTSRKPGGFNEPTASIVWSTLLGAGIDPNTWVNWNAFPWHPHPAGQPLGNRTPTPSELSAATPVLGAMQALFPQARLIAVGAKAAQLLRDLGLSFQAVRHPARGGANEFRRQILELL
jgi:hypothetical protein